MTSAAKPLVRPFEPWPRYTEEEVAAVAEVLLDGGAEVEHDMDLLIGFEDGGGRDVGELVDDAVDVLLRDPGIEVQDLILEEADEDRLLAGGAEGVGPADGALGPAEVAGEHLDGRVFDFRQFFRIVGHG